MIKKQLLFTFDYELFLGKKSGSVDNCMIEPTKKVVSILNQYKIKGIFFVDCSYLNRLEEVIVNHPKAMIDYNKIKNQILQLIEQGHYIYPHVHPHWIDALYLPKNNEWDLSDNSKYRFNSLTDDQKNSHFNAALNALRKILTTPEQKFNNYFDAYRAGGWCIQPFTHFEPFFKESKIYADFSVLGGSVKNGNTLFFDYSNIKQNAKPYQFEHIVTEESKDGKYVEFPISSIPFDKSNFLNKIINKVLWRLPVGQNMGDGISSPFKSSIPPSNYDSYFEMVSIELFSINKLKKYKKFIKENNYMQFISHPKMISNHNLKMLSSFLNSASKKYELETDWKNIIIK